MKKNRKKKTAQPATAARRMSRLDLWILLITAALLLLERLPKGVLCRFVEGDTYCSYFDLLPFRYGDFFPLITAVLTVVFVLILLAARFWKKDRLQQPVLLMAYVIFGTATTAFFTGLRFDMLTWVRAVLPLVVLVLITLLQKTKNEA